MASEDIDGGFAEKLIVKFKEMGIKVLVWDFDKTLTGKGLHVCGTWRTKFDVLEREAVRSHFADADLLFEIVQKAREAGIDVYVATFGYFKAILHYMHLLYTETGVPCPFSRETIITPSVFEEVAEGCRDGCYMPKCDDAELTKKNRQLAHIVRSRRCEKKEICFFDDTEENVVNAVAVGYTHSYFVNGSVGLTVEEYIRLLGL